MIKENAANWQYSSHITQRIIITGDLVFQTPAHIGGSSNSGIDMQIVRDVITGAPRLAGSTLAGALRNYLKEREKSYGYEDNAKEDSLLMAQQLFGYVISGSKAKSAESWLTISDAHAIDIGTEIRFGVAINPKTRTASNNQLFNVELLQAGTTFPLYFELTTTHATAGVLKKALAIALQGLERGEIRLGMRKRRGFGVCKVTEWKVQTVDLQEPWALIAWLERNEEQLTTKCGTSIADLLDVPVPLKLPDERIFFEITACFGLENSNILIRAESADPTVKSPDMTHLKSYRPQNKAPINILSGTSIAGVIRARANRICNTMKANLSVDDLFGPPISDDLDERQYQLKKASRVIVEETEIINGLDWVQTRVKIDRFTGGSFDSALFDQMPVFGHVDTRVPIQLTIIQPKQGEIGLILQVLKDLWTGDLPIGGESSVGRGRLRGCWARLKYGQHQWEIKETNNRLTIDASAGSHDLDVYAQEFSKMCGVKNEQ